MKGKYYRITRTSDNSIPIIQEERGAPRYLVKLNPIEDPEELVFVPGKPIPRKPKFVDYHSSPKPIVSKRIFDVLNPLAIEGIQFLPSTIRHGGVSHKDYFAIHVFNRIQCVDRDKSICEFRRIAMAEVKKIVLDTERLNTIPIAKRLIFRLQEDSSYYLFHESIVEKVLDIDPIGLRFVDIENWNNGSFFS